MAKLYCRELYMQTPFTCRDLHIQWTCNWELWLQEAGALPAHTGWEGTLDTPSVSLVLLKWLMTRQISQRSAVESWVTEKPVMKRQWEQFFLQSRTHSNHKTDLISDVFLSAEAWRLTYGIIWVTGVRWSCERGPDRECLCYTGNFTPFIEWKKTLPRLLSEHQMKMAKISNQQYLHTCMFCSAKYSPSVSLDLIPAVWPCNWLSSENLHSHTIAVINSIGLIALHLLHSHVKH